MKTIFWTKKFSFFKNNFFNRKEFYENSFLVENLSLAHFTHNMWEIVSLFFSFLLTRKLFLFLILIVKKTVFEKSFSVSIQKKINSHFLVLLNKNRNYFFSFLNRNILQNSFFNWKIPFFKPPFLKENCFENIFLIEFF